ARNGLLAAMALQLAGDTAGAPVLVIDWDLESPSLHRYFGALHNGGDAADADHADDSEPPGLVEYIDALRGELRRRRGAREDGSATSATSAEAVADAVLDAVDWRAYIGRADGRRPLYLMRAGRFDDDYAERAGRLDWVALFDACPALLRRFAARMASHFRHVLVACRAGRSASVSACTTLVPDRLVGLFTPAPGSLDGLEGVVRRAIEYRCTHEDEQRPLLVYPVACSADGARSDPAQSWRRGDASQGQAGYQQRLEALLRNMYGISRLRLESWFDEVQLPLCDCPGLGIGVGALAHPVSCLLSWFAHGGLPWQSLAEVRLRAALARAAAQADAGPDAALAGKLMRLGLLCQEEGPTGEAGELLRESLALRCATLGDEHPDARAVLAALAALHLASAELDAARRDYELLVQRSARGAGTDHPDTLAARSGLACVLGCLGEGERALALHEQVVAACERLWGEVHPATLDSVEALAVTLGGQHENDRARVLFERVLDGRRRLQGGEHEDTLRCAERLARLLGQMGDLGNARRLLEGALRARERHDGGYASSTLRTRQALAEIFAAQGDMAAVRSIQDTPTWPRGQEFDPGSGEAGRQSAFDSLQTKCAQLKDLVDREDRHEARVLADKLRHSVPWPSVALPLRKLMTALIEQVYLQEGDKDAALAFNKDLLSSLEGALSQAGRGQVPGLY
ncbi:MAG: tetratricopeptide repeat protein, partial [Lysobacteraceae bacterium]